MMKRRLDLLACPGLHPGALRTKRCGRLVACINWSPATGKLWLSPAYLVSRSVVEGTPGTVATEMDKIAAPETADGVCIGRCLPATEWALHLGVRKPHLRFVALVLSTSSVAVRVQRSGQAVRVQLPGPSLGYCPSRHRTVPSKPPEVGRW